MNVKSLLDQIVKEMIVNIKTKGPAGVIRRQAVENTVMNILMNVNAHPATRENSSERRGLGETNGREDVILRQVVELIVKKILLSAKNFLGLRNVIRQVCRVLIFPPPSGGAPPPFISQFPPQEMRQRSEEQFREQGKRMEEQFREQKKDGEEQQREQRKQGEEQRREERKDFQEKQREENKQTNELHPPENEKPPEVKGVSTAYSFFQEFLKFFSRK